MSTLIRLAIRNVLRNRSRSGLAFGAVFLGATLTVVLTGFGHGLGSLMMSDVIDGKVGAIQLHKKGYAARRENQPLDLDIPIGGTFEAKIRDIPGVLAVAPRLVFGGLVNNGRTATMFVGRGVDPTKDYVVLPASLNDIAGRPISEEARNHGLIGAELAHALGATIGSTLTLQTTTRTRRQNALELEAAGTLENINGLEKKRLVHVPLAYAQDLLEMRGRVTEYLIRVDDRRKIDAVAGALQSAVGPDYEVETWRELQPDIADMIHFQDAVVGLISLVFLLIVIFGVINTMLMSVLERMQEIGTMMALGFGRGKISLLFVLEAAVLAIVGGCSGVAAGHMIVSAITASGGIKLSAPGTFVERFRLVPILPPELTPIVIIGCLLGAVAAAAYPAWKVSGLRPVEALRQV